MMMMIAIDNYDLN